MKKIFPDPGDRSFIDIVLEKKSTVIISLNFKDVYSTKICKYHLYPLLN